MIPRIGVAKDAMPSKDTGKRNVIFQVFIYSLIQTVNLCLTKECVALVVKDYLI